MMPKLLLQFEGRLLKECAMASAVTIGRLPDNTVVVDNPAVSAHHARIVCEGEACVVEDLDSRNGTFVNEQRITRHTLQHGDVVLVGKHKLVFDAAASDEPAAVATAAPAVPDFGSTLLLDTDQQRKLLAAINARLRADAAAAAPVGVLRVIAGRADHAEYSLDAAESLIGRSEGALVRLRGWFKPKAALAIARMGEGYVATLVGGKTLVNGQRLTGRRGLEHGDLLQVCGLTLEFRWKDAPRHTAPALVPRSAALVPTAGALTP
jgi:pSer/pThr/pTyr-binding forkhead associated (FHA) protein